MATDPGETQKGNLTETTVFLGFNFLGHLLKTDTEPEGNFFNRWCLEVSTKQKKSLVKKNTKQGTSERLLSNTEPLVGKQAGVHRVLEERGSFRMQRL